MTSSAVVARPYAKAAFAIAKKQGALDAWDSMLAFYAELIPDKRVQAFLKKPQCTVSRALQFLFSFREDSLAGDIKKFFEVLARADRLLLLPQIASQFNWLCLQEQRTLALTLEVAKPISDTFVQAFRKALQHKHRCEVQLNVVVEPQLIGGAVIRIGDDVIDDSVRGRLSRLAESFI